MFAVNKSHGHLVLKTGYVQISKGSFAKVTQDDLDLPDFKDAIAKGWLVVEDKEPTGLATPELKVEDLGETSQGMNEADMKAELAKINGAPIPGEVTPLGNDTQVMGEATSTKIGEPEAEVKAEDVAAESKKARAKKAE